MLKFPTCLLKALNRIRVLPLAALALVAIGSSAPAQSHTLTFTWTWPTLRADGSALPLASIGGATIYDTSIPLPGMPGTAVACGSLVFPPTTATATCTTGTVTTDGKTHTYIVITQDNSTPPDSSGPSNVVSIALPFAGPAAVTNLAGALN